MSRAKLYRRLIVPAMALLVALPTLIVSASDDLVPLSGPVVNKTLATVAFGDSNTTDFAGGIVNWYERLASLNAANPLQQNTPTATIVYSLSLNNQSVGGKSVAPTILGTQNAQYDIVAALNNVTHADFGFVMLGTNDAYRGVTVANFVTSYEQLIARVQTSGKVGRLVILSVPPMTPPYNCLSGCYPFPNNPQVDRVVPYNQQMTTLLAYCRGIRYSCAFVDSSSQIPLDSTYIDPNTGIHVLNPAQAVIGNNVFSTLRMLLAVQVPQPRNPPSDRPTVKH